jgi:hypothetical protein
MQRWFLRTLLSLILFTVTVMIAGRFVSGAAYLLLRAGSPMLHDWLQTHFAWRAFVVGVTAGIFPATLLPAIFGWFAPKDNSLASEITPFLANLDLERFKRWVWIFFSPLFTLGFVRWTSQLPSASVFETHTRYTLASLIDYFTTSTDCVNSLWTYRNYDFACLSHVYYLWLVMASIGYSLAPTIRKAVIAAFGKAYPKDDVASLPNEVQESTMDQKTDLQ